MNSVGKKSKAKITIIILSLIFLIMLILNFFTPLIDDDFGYSLNLSKEHLTSLRDIANFQINHYKTWGGRILAHTIAQIFLMFPKYIFNIFNSLCFMVLIFLMYILSSNKEEKNPLLLIIIFFGVYFLTPVFGQNTLWLIGSCNYLWTTTIILLLISVYKINETKKDNWLLILIMFLLGIAAGWTNENSSIGSLIIIILFTFLNKKNIRKWKISGIVGNIIGFTAMILAPGNFSRDELYEEKISFVTKILNRFIDCSKGIIIYLLPIVILFILLLVIYKYKKKKLNKDSFIFMAGAIFTIYPMILSPTFPERSWFSIIVFSIISVSILLDEIINQKLYKYLIIILLSITSIVFIIDYINLAKDIKKLNNVWTYRTKYIKNNPNRDEFVFKMYYTKNKKNPNYGQLDLMKDKDQWPNNDIEKYFKIKSIVAK